MAGGGLVGFPATRPRPSILNGFRPKTGSRAHWLLFPFAVCLLPDQQGGQLLPVGRREGQQGGGERFERSGGRLGGRPFALPLVPGRLGVTPRGYPAGVCIFAFAGASSGASGGKRFRKCFGGSSYVWHVTASQAGRRGFESPLPLLVKPCE